MSSKLAFGRLFAVTLLSSMGAAGCGGDEDPKPPQIQPHQNPVAFQNMEPGAEARQFQVILSNVGDGTLDITEVAVSGDANCALDPPPELDLPLPVHLTSEQEAFLNINYIPGGTHNDEVGTKDQISIGITSNSAEFPLMEISVCGCIVADASGAPPCECNLLEVGDANCGG